MLFDSETWPKMADGSVTVAYRNWKRPTVKAGGTLLTSIGRLKILSLEPTDLDELDEGDARAAGFADLASLRTTLAERREARLYRIGLELAGPDPRIALRASIPEGPELAELREKLSRWPWARNALRRIRDRPAVRAADLAARMPMETSRFKAIVRRLKALGLTQSLEVGYRLSPRGEFVLANLEDEGV
jgi:hypothetical protein